MRRIKAANARLLHTIIERLKYKSNWSFGVFQDALSLRVAIETDDSTGRHNPYRSTKFMTHQLLFDTTPWSSDEPQPFVVVHSFSIPDYPMDEEAAERWILDRIFDIEQHEAMEFFKLDGKAVYFPDHEPGGKPYAVTRR